MANGEYRGQSNGRTKYRDVAVAVEAQAAATPKRQDQEPRQQQAPDGHSSDRIWKVSPPSLLQVGFAGIDFASFTVTHPKDTTRLYVEYVYIQLKLKQ